MKHYVVHTGSDVHICRAADRQAVRTCYRDNDGIAVKVKACPRWMLKEYQRKKVPEYIVLSLTVR